jgi:hypothetical protein
MCVSLICDACSVKDLVIYDKDQGMPQDELLEAVKGAHGENI